LWNSIRRCVFTGPAQRDKHRTLGRRQPRGGKKRFADERVQAVGFLRRAVGQDRHSHADLVSVVQPDPTDHPLAVDERAVARQPIVNDRPHATDALQLRMQPGDQEVTLDDHVRAPRRARSS
jgi:hypothetical protein